MIDMKQNPNPIAGKHLALVRRTHGMILLKFNRKQANSTTFSGPGRSGKSMTVVLPSIGLRMRWFRDEPSTADGACRIDPARFIPLLEAMGAEVEPCLARLYLSQRIHAASTRPAIGTASR